MWFSLLFYCALFFMGVPTQPLNVLSLIHASSTVLMYYGLHWDVWILYNSIAYFLVDSYITWGSYWVLHHGLAILGLIPALVYPDLREFMLPLFGLAEIGGVLYHISRLYGKNKACRQLFLVTYGFSRFLATLFFFPLVIEVFTNVDRSIVHHFAAVVQTGMVAALIPFNWWFFSKQLQLYQRDFTIPHCSLKQ